MANDLLLEEARRRGFMSVDPGLLEEAQRRGLTTKKRTARQPLPHTNRPPAEEQSLLSQMWTRPTGVMGGATTGAGLGSAAGPVGTLVGGGLGALAGSLIFDLSKDMPEIIETTRRGGIGDVGPMIETSKRALGEMKEELMWGGGTMAAGPALRQLGKPLLGRAMGLLNPQSRRMADLARAQGIDLGAAHVSPSKLVKGAPRVLGVFPYVGTPYRKGQARVVGQLDERAADLLNTLAPASTRYDLAKKLTSAAVKRYAKFDRVASTLYKQFYKIADELPVKDIVPTQPLKQELAEVARREGVEEIILETGKPFRNFGVDDIGEWLKQMDGLPDQITVEQARGLERKLNALIRKGGQEGWDMSRLEGMKGALTDAKNSLDVTRLNPEDAERVLDAWNKANKFFAATKTGFQTPTAKRFGRVDKNIFGKGVFKPGTINQDEIFSAVYQAKSPEALSDLRTLVGPGEFKKASRKFLETTFKAAHIKGKEGGLIGDMFSASDFEKRLGLDTEEGWIALNEILKGSDTTVKDWRNFLEVAKKATDITIRDPSTFVMRRITLAGLSGVAGAAVMGAGHMSLSTAAFISYVARRSAKGLMSGEQLRNMTRVLTDKTPDHLRRTLITRFLRLSADSEDRSRVPNIRGRLPAPR